MNFELDEDTILLRDSVRELGKQKAEAVPQWEEARALPEAWFGELRELGLLGRVRGKHRAAALACLERVGMAEFAERQIGQLSGGQQQRVFLARALAQDADLYLLDEPFAGVDAATEKAVISVLHALKSQGKTVVAVHHDLSTVRDYFDRVFLINTNRVAEGDVESTFTAANLQSAYGGRLARAQMDKLSNVAG